MASTGRSKNAQILRIFTQSFRELNKLSNNYTKQSFEQRVIAKIPKGSDVGDKVNLWYRWCNFTNPTLKNWSNTQDFYRILCRIS
jgi:hypothetical protein